MRVVFIENEDVNRDSSGGIMSYILNLSNYLRNKGWKTALIGTGNNVFNHQKTTNRFSCFFSISISSSISNFKFFIKLFTSSEIISIDKNDIVHVQRPEMVIPIFLRKRNKIVCTLHGGQDIAVKKKKGWIISFVYSILQFVSFLMVDQIIVVDRKNLNRYVKKYSWIKKKITLIPISVDTNKFYPVNNEALRRKYNFSQNDRILLFVGRLEYEKNVEFLIDSFKENTDKNSKLLIVGGGSLLNSLKNRANSNKNNILFLGEVNNTVIPEIINISDALVLCSYFEGSPTVIKESLCCRVPVLSTDVGDVKEVLETVNGGEIIDFTKESLLFSFDKIKHRKKEISEDVSTIFGLKKMGDRTMSIYKNF
jgi:glycosyltransferase involved in cell wall biosynthesis